MSKTYSSLAVLLLLICLSACKKETTQKELGAILAWHQFALKADRYTEGFKTPVAARTYAYSAIAAWESAVAAGALPQEKSLQARIPALHITQNTTKANTKYYLPAVLDACYNQIFEKLFIGNPRNIEQERKALYQERLASYKSEIDDQTLMASTDLGQSIALQVHQWAATDSFGNLGQMHNYDPHYVPPPGDSIWEPCRDFPTPSLLPHWGNCRTFAIKTEEFVAGPPPPYSELAGSQLHKQALELFILNSPISEENMHLAEFWSDDHPSLTFSSAGRWISIINQILEHEQASTEKALKTYLLSSIAMSDAIVSCWNSKYKYNLLRPETYIRRTMNPNWRPIMHTPPFPAYPSGHAMIGYATATVLESLFGEDYQFTDRSHAGRKEFASEPRSYARIRDMATESSNSRIALGVHYRVDCEEGDRLGIEIGKAILMWVGDL
jgi:hypothetical protein